jgi:hypothetical protein
MTLCQKKRELIELDLNGGGASPTSLIIFAGTKNGQ